MYRKRRDGLRTAPTTPACKPHLAALNLEAAATYVLGRRTPEGGFCFYRTPQWGVEEPNTPDTLAALASLRLLGVAAPEPEATARWLQGVQSDDGSYPCLTIGWAAVRALDLLGLSPYRSVQTWLSSWAERLLARRATPRDWRAAPGNVLRLAELLNPDAQRCARVAELLSAAADPQGGWAHPGADVETTAMAMQLAHLAHITAPNLAGVAEFLFWL